MIKLTINNNKTHLPLKKFKGSAIQRMKKSKELTDQFFDNVKGTFGYGDVSLNIFTQILTKYVPQNIKMEVLENFNPTTSNLSLHITNTGEIQGYTLFLPLAKNKISKSNIGNIMQSVLEMFTRILNPKYNKRGIDTINKNLNNSKITQLLNTICSSKVLTDSDLDKSLAGNTTQEKIDILQNIRYNIKLKLDKYKIHNKYQKEIENLYKYKNMSKTEPIKYTQFQFPQKIKLIETKLAQIIKEERQRLIHS